LVVHSYLHLLKDAFAFGPFELQLHGACRRLEGGGLAEFAGFIAARPWQTQRQDGGQQEKVFIHNRHLSN
jgi:hypothetical protein